jgi:hypothetical protein
MEHIVNMPLSGDLNSVHSVGQLLGDSEGTYSLSTELLGGGISGKVDSLKPHPVTNIDFLLQGPLVISKSLLCLLCSVQGQLTVGLDQVNGLESIGHVSHLVWGGTVSVHRVITIVCKEGGGSSGWVVVVIVGEFCCVEGVCPVVLLIGTEHVEVGLEPFVIGLNLSLCLGVVGHGEVLVYS